MVYHHEPHFQKDQHKITNESIPKIGWVFFQLCKNSTVILNPVFLQKNQLSTGYAKEARMSTDTQKN